MTKKKLLKNKNSNKIQRGCVNCKKKSKIMKFQGKHTSNRQIFHTDTHTHTKPFAYSGDANCKAGKIRIHWKRTPMQEPYAPKKMDLSDSWKGANNFEK